MDGNGCSIQTHFLSYKPFLLAIRDGAVFSCGSESVFIVLFAPGGAFSHTLGHTRRICPFSVMYEVSVNISFIVALPLR